MVVARGVCLRNTGRTGVLTISLVVGMKPMFVSMIIVITIIIATIIIVVMTSTFALIMLS